MAEDFQYRHRRTERLFKWVASFAFIFFVALVGLAIAQWKDYYDVRQMLGW